MTRAAAPGEVSRLKRAVVALTGRVDASPTSGPTALALAEGLRRLAARTEDPAAAARYLAKACAADPYSVTTRIRLGKRRLEAGEVQGAVDALREGVELCRGHADAGWHLAVTLLEFLRSEPNAKLADLALKGLAASDDVAIVAVRLWCACFAKTSKQDRNRLLPLLPSELSKLKPSPDLVPFMTRLGLSIAYALPYRQSSKKQSIKERKAVDKGLAGLTTGLAPWLEAYPDDPGLASVMAAVSIARASADDLADAIIAATPKFTKAALLQLFAHQALSLLPAPQRVSVLDDVAGKTRLGGGLDRELLGAIGVAARDAIAADKLDEAGRLWHRGLELDPYNAALHHNLSLLALARRDSRRFAVHEAARVDLLLTRWVLAGHDTDVLRQIAARYESFANRLREPVDAALQTKDGELDGGLLASWAGEALAGLVLRALLLEGDTEPSDEITDAVVDFVRSIPLVADPGAAVPDVLLKRLNAPVSGQPPLHYDTIGVPSGAPPSAVRKRYKEATESLSRIAMESRMKGEKGAAEMAAAKIKRLDEAWAVLSDLDKRKRYDSDTISATEHDFHMARRKLLEDLHEFGNKLGTRERNDLVQMFIRVRRHLPLDGLEAYLDALQPGVGRVFERNFLGMQYRVATEEAQRLIKDEEWDAAKAILSAAIEAGATRMPFAHYLMAVAEMRGEAAHVHKHKRTSAEGVDVTAGARERLEELGGEDPEEEEEEDHLTMLRRLLEEAMRGDS